MAVSPQPTQADNTALTPKDVEASRILLSQVIFPRDTNELGFATAGVILKAIDITASLTASKHSVKKIVTASLDRMDFVNPARMWDLVTTQCFLTKTWRSSMEIEVIVETERMMTGVKSRVASGYLVFVALDDQTLKSTPVPPLLITTPNEAARAEAAEVRKQARLIEQKQLGERPETYIDSADMPERVFRTMTPNDANIHHNVFGGVILEMIHQAGEKAAARQVNGPVIAVRQDRMSFDQPAYIGEEVTAEAVVTRTWHTSIEVQADVVAKDHKTGERRLVASSYLVFVAQDPEEHPKAVPAFEPKTERQKQRWLEAEIRRTTRMQERTQSDKISG